MPRKRDRDLVRRACLELVSGDKKKGVVDDNNGNERITEYSWLKDVHERKILNERS